MTGLSKLNQIETLLCNTPSFNQEKFDKYYYLFRVSYNLIRKESSSFFLIEKLLCVSLQFCVLSLGLEKNFWCYRKYKKVLFSDPKENDPKEYNI